MTIGILLFVIVISLLVLGLMLYNDFRRSYYEKEIDKAFMDMEKGIITVITDEANGSFSVKKTKDGKKL